MRDERERELCRWRVAVLFACLAWISFASGAQQFGLEQAAGVGQATGVEQATTVLDVAPRLESELGLRPVASMLNSSAPPVPCDEEYAIAGSASNCRYMLVNENYFAVVTARSGPDSGTGEEVADWVTSLASNFQLYYSSRPQTAAPNASEPPPYYRMFSTPNATSAPGDLHVFFRPGLGAKIESVLDALVAQRTKEWFFSPLFKGAWRTASRDWVSNHHEVFMPVIWVSDPNGTPPLTLQSLRGLVGPGDRVEHRSLSFSRTRFRVYPVSRSGFETLELEVSLAEQRPTAAFWNRPIPYFLPGDSANGGPSGGPPSAGATAVPLSDFGSFLLAGALALSALLWLRRQ